MTEGWPDFWLRGKKIDLIDLVETINLIKQINTIKALYNAQIRIVGIANGDFETGDLTGWFTYFTGPEYGSIEVSSDRTFHGDYACKITVASPMGTSTPEIDQLVMMPTNLIERIDFFWFGEPDTKFWLGLEYTDLTTDDFYYTNESLFARWYHAEVTNADLPADKTVVKVGMGPAADAVNEGKTFYLDAVGMLLRTDVHQAEKDRIISNFPAEYPLPSSQISELKNVIITDVSKTVTVKSFDVPAGSSGNYVVWQPTSGKAIRLKLVQYESDTDVEVGLRFGPTGNLFARRITAGVMALNLIGCNIQGGTDQVLYLYTAGAVNVKGFVLGEEI